jgi:hypothetical protein
MSEHEETRAELEAALRARGELGAELEPQVIDAFVERIERRIDERTRELRPMRVRTRGSDQVLALAIVSLGVSIPLTAIAVTQAGLVGLLVVWIGIVLVNAAFART